MAEATRTVMEKANARFADAQKKTVDRKKAMAEYELEAKARNIKTAKLRALRLAKEEADRAAEALEPPKVKTKRVRAAAKPAAAKGAA